MKKNILLLGVMALLILSACQDLEREIVTTLSEKQVTESYDYTEARANSVYSELRNGFSYISGAMMASATDEAEFTLETAYVQNINTGFWNATSNPDNVWEHYYEGIRKANQFMVSADSVDLEAYRLNPNVSSQEEYQRRLAEIENWKVEVRLLRAYFYFELVKRYGGVPILTEALTLDDNYLDFDRKPLSECIQFIITECDDAANLLPVTYPDVDLGRVTKGTALAIKSRVLLYAASDLFNTTSWASSYANTDLISVTGDRQAKWKAAADAAKAVIDLNAYSLSSSYSGLFSAANYNDGEVILAVRNGDSNSFEKACAPISYQDGQSGTTPSQNMVDAYEMADGSKFDWNNAAHAADPYSNRDPRLKMSILTNNTDYKGRPVECWTDGKDGKGTVRATKTGYYMLKYVDTGLDLQQGMTSVHTWIMIRLAEVYLNYAEALNEYSPGHDDIATYVNMVRARGGVNMPALPTGLSQQEMREKIRNERMVEFAFEDHRAWDVRRWMIADQTLGVPLRGVEITKSESGFTYNPITVENRAFQPKMYLYPIPQSELNIMKDWVQNPLW
jgi:hypothetical protein